MKLIRILFSSIAAVCLMASCDTNLEVYQLDSESEFVSPTITAPGEIKLTADILEAEKPITFTWSAANFGQPVEIVYNINASYNGSSTVLFAKLNGTSYSVKSPELAEKLVNLGVPKGKSVNMTINMDCTIGSNFKTLKSPDKTISVYVE